MSRRHTYHMNPATRRIFFRSLATMLGAGLTISESLEHLEQEGTADMSAAVERLSTSLMRGQRLSVSMQQSGLFPKFHCSLIKVGEETGALTLVLHKLARHEESSMNLRQMLVSRMTYPAVLFVAALLMLVFLPAFCLEGLFQVLENSHVPLPLLTRAFIASSRLMRQPLVLVLLALVTAAAVYAARTALAHKSTRDRVNEILAGLPVIGPPLRCYYLATFTEALSLQLTVGLSSLPALQSSVALTDDPQLERDVALAIERIKHGSTLGEAFADADSFTPMLCSMLMVGEESGKLPGLLERTAKYYALEVDHALEVLSGTLEPLVLAVMGVVFGVMLVALMSPLVTLIQTI